MTSAIFLLALLGFSISLAQRSLLSGYSVEEQPIRVSSPGSIISSQLSKALIVLESKYSLLRSTTKSPLSIEFTSIDRSYASLSLTGTLGDNGWYTSNVKGSFYLAGENSDSATVEYAFYNQPWSTYSEPFTIFEEGQTQIYYRVREATGFVWDTKFSAVDIDKTPPNGSVLIEEGATDAFSTLVTLTLSVIDGPSGPTTPPPTGYIWGVPSGPSRMRFSNNGIIWSDWESIAKTKTWTLETGAGPKTVYVQARDNAGLLSEPFSDTINLIITGDSIAPVTKIIVNGKKDSSGVFTSAVTITLSATDDLSGVSQTEYSYDSQTWVQYTTPVPFYTEGETTIYFRSRDANGNVETTNSQIIEIRKIEESNSFLPFAIAGIIALVAGIVVAFVLIRKNRNSQNQKFDELSET